MTRLPALALIFGICLFRPGVVSAMARPGLNDYVSNALVITLVRAQTPDEAAAFPAPVANQRVIVQQVLKGVETRQEFLLPAGSLKPGARGLVLFRFKGEFFELSPTRDKPDPEIVIWSLKDDGIIDIKNTPLEYMRVDIPWRVVNDYVATASPEEVNLNERVTEALLFPEKFKAFATGNARRAAYVRFVIAVRDLGRDVPALAGFLESDDADTRAAAEARLKALTHADVPEPKDDSPAALADWSAAWAKQTLPIQPPKLSDWPAIPANAKQPPDAFPKALLKAVQDGNPDAFAQEFAAWLDSGVMRDRQVTFAERTLPGEVEDNPFFEPDGKKHEHSEFFVDFNLVTQTFFNQSFLVPAPRLPMDLALNPKVPAVQRLQYMAMLAHYYLYNRFAAEMKARLDFIGGQPAKSEAVKRAAFWEPKAEFSDWETPRTVALGKLKTGDSSK